MSEEIGSVTVHHGDSRDVLKTIADASIDSVVCDPPYALVSIGKRFGADGAAPAKPGKSGAYARASAGFMGQKWDTGETAFDPEFWAEVLRVLKPGGHLIAFSGTRTYHRLACAVEDGGFEIRDMVAWLYGSGFPKSHDVAKGIDKAAGVAFEARPASGVGFMGPDGPGGYNITKNQLRRTGESTPAARAWEGWGTALKPALEPIVLARKPLAGTVAANVLEHGTGALNIDACRIEGEPVPVFETNGGRKFNPGDNPEQGVRQVGISNAGRWPANVVHDGSDEVVEAFPQSKGQQGVVTGREPSAKTNAVYGEFGGRPATHPRGDGGSAARFFYAAEPDDLCGLCGCPLEPLSAKLSPCNANTAEPSSPTESTPSAGTAPSGAAASQPRGRGGKSQRSSDPATIAESCSQRPRLTDSDTAAGPVSMPPPSSLVQSVRSAGSLCGSCATAIAQSLAATQRGHDLASLPCPASIGERNWRILTNNLALYVAGREHTATITTTDGLKTLLGSVFHAIAATTSSERAESVASTGPDQRRFHYSSKADAEDRLGSKHPTVKPVDLMRWLCRLVTPPGGVVLDPFAGTGSTGLAAQSEGLRSVLIEREAQYVADIRRRLMWARGEGRLTAQETAKIADKSVDDLPLFGG